MKSFNVEIGSKLKLESYCMRVVARNKKEAIKKIQEKGFNAGERLSTTYSGKFVVSNIDEVHDGNNNKK